MNLEQIFQDRLNGKYPESAMQDHLLFLRDLVVRTEARQVVELGVHTGQSTIAFILGLEETDGQLLSIDNRFPKDPIKDVFEAYPGRLTFILGDSRNCMPFCPIPVDILLIDAALENRLEDLRDYGALVGTGGFILVHDTERPEVMTAVGTYLIEREHKAFTNIQHGHGLAVIEV